ncbi:MAG: hypothetical protein CMO34_07980 [Verrucomicrobia bacterium]|nr:hypothetical protein [Verrucomicrobiota bacterium]|tara:strand:+ start:248 stop:508 length:261 start_codon:yes stop_codon:yes gene_type:complete
MTQLDKQINDLLNRAEHWKEQKLGWLERDRYLAAADTIFVLQEAINMALACTPVIKENYGHPVIVYDCGDPWEILRQALEVAYEQD